MANLSKDIITENNENEFQIRFINDENVGILHSRSDKSYFILDSFEYWYDLIQEKYPSVKKCSCKNDWFKIKFEYEKRKENNDFCEIIIHLTCTNCMKQKSFPIEIDYSPTNELYNKPITFCEHPILRCNLYQLSELWDENSFKKFLNYMFNTLKLKAVCWYYHEKRRILENVNFERLTEILNDKHETVLGDRNYKFYSIFLSQSEISHDKMIKDEESENRGSPYLYGTYLKEDLWRRLEVIELKAPINVVGRGMLYRICACEQFIIEGKIEDKSDSFKKIVTQMLKWITDIKSARQG